MAGLSNIQDLQKEINVRQQHGIPVNDLQAKLKSMQASVSPKLTYAQGSAYGPATLQQTMNAAKTGGSVYIVPADTPASAPIQEQKKDLGQNQDVNQGFTQEDINKATQTAYDKAAEEYKAQAQALKEARINAAIAGLQNKFNQTIGDISSKRSAITPTYDAKRLQAQASSQLQAKNFAEFLANRGLSRSGTSQQAELMRNLSLQQTFNQYDAQKKADEDYLTNMENQARQALANDEMMARNEAETNYLNNFLQYKAQQDANLRNELLKREEMAYNKQKDKGTALQKLIDAQNEKAAKAEEAINKKEIDTYGFNLNSTQRKMLKSFEDAMQDPRFAQVYNAAYNADGGIAKILEEARAAGREDWVQALEGGRFSKVLNEGMTKYGGQYALPQKWYQNALDTESKGADARIKMIKSNFAYDLENLGLEKLANDVRNGNLDNVKKEIEVSYLPEEKKAELMNKYANIQQTQTQTKYIPFNAQTSRMNANTSAYSAETARKNYNLNVEKFGEDKQRNLDKQQETAYKDIDDYILNIYTQVDSNKRTVMSVQDKKDIGAYLDGLAVQGVDVNVVKALRAKYNVNN